MSWQPPSGPKSNSKFVPTFKDRVNTMIPTGKVQVTGVILPGYDFRLLEQGVGFRDPVFLSSCAPFRDVTGQESDDGHLPILPPMAMINEHSNFGPNGDYIVSPLCRPNLYPVDGIVGDADDPIVHILNYLQDYEKNNNKTPHPEWGYLLGDGKNRDTAKIQFPSAKAFFNILGKTSKDAPGATFSPGVMKLSNSGWEELRRLANIRRPAEVTHPMDPEAPGYLYGRLWDPNGPLVFKTSQKQLIATSGGGGGAKFTCTVFSRHEGTLEGAEKGGPIPQELLNQRVNLWDPNVYNIMSYTQLLEYILAHNIYPKALLVAACSHKPGTESILGSNEATGAAPAGQQTAAPAAPAGPAAPSTPAYGAAPAGSAAPAAYGSAPAGPAAPSAPAYGAAPAGPAAPAAPSAPAYGAAPAGPAAPAAYGSAPSAPAAYGSAPSAPAYGAAPAGPAAPAAPPAPPVAPAAPPAPPAPPEPPAAPAEPSFWISHPTLCPAPQLKTKSEVQSLVDEGHTGIQAMDEAMTVTWTPVESMGFAKDDIPFNHPPATQQPAAQPAAQQESPDLTPESKARIDAMGASDRDALIESVIHKMAVSVITPQEQAELNYASQLQSQA